MKKFQINNLKCRYDTYNNLWYVITPTKKRIKESLSKEEAIRFMYATKDFKKKK